MESDPGGDWTIRLTDEVIHHYTDLTKFYRALIAYLQLSVGCTITTGHGLVLRLEPCTEVNAERIGDGDLTDGQRQDLAVLTATLPYPVKGLP